MSARLPEDKAREQIDEMLAQSGWVVQNRSEINLSAARGVAIREVSMRRKHGEADYLLFADGKAIATVEAKPEGWTLTGVEEQSGKYGKGLLDIYPSWRQPLPFAYESTGTETRFTNRLDPNPASRNVFSFHRPETLVEWVQQPAQLNKRLSNLLTSDQKLITTNLWSAQVEAIRNLERSLAENKPRALIQMATGSGKTFTAVNFVYRLIKHAGARRILFLVDRGNLGDQTLKEFQQFSTPDDGRKFTELYNVQHLQSAQLDSVSRVCISTIQRLYSMLKGEELDPELDEASGERIASLFKDPLPVAYNPIIPIETFDFIVTDECHRSIYNLWRQVLEYFDAYLIGLTATPNKQTFGFFKQNLVQEYGHERAVADRVNVNYDVYRIRTKITEQGATVEKGFYVDKRHRQTRRRRWEQLDDDLDYDAAQLDRDVVADDQIRTVIRTFRDRLFTEIFPGRSTVPKTLIFAKDDSHADDIVKIVREEFGKGNDFCQKITYRTTGAKPKDLIQKFRNSHDPRIAVTVDMIATGTDIKPLEIVMFMRSVKSRGFFEQMKGRGVRVISDTDFQSVTPDAKAKTHFVIVDCVGVCERDKSDSRPLEQKRNVPLDKLLEAIAMGVREPEALSSLAGRLIRLEKRLEPEVQAEVEKLTGGKSLSALARSILDSIDPDVIEAKAAEGKPDTYVPPEDVVREISAAAVKSAVAPVANNPTLRNKLIELQRAIEQTIDTVSKDILLGAGPDQKTADNLRESARSFRKYIEEHKSEIEALEILYSRPYGKRLGEKMLKELETKLREHRASWTEDRLWDSFAADAPDKVKGKSQAGRFADLVSLVRFGMAQQPVLEPFADSVNQRFESWLREKDTLSIGLRANASADRQSPTSARVRDRPVGSLAFSQEQLSWLHLIRDHIATSLSIEPEDFDLAPFNQHGGLGKAHYLFGNDLEKLLNELNEVLAA
jgi:type I restriction enzyme, R subunit